MNSGSGAYGRLFRNRNFVALWLGQTVSFVGDYFYFLAIPIMVERLTGSSLQVGLAVIASALPLFRDDLFDGVLTAFTDITELKDAENRLRESEEKYRTLVENINVGVFRTSVEEQGSFIHANTAIVEMFGYDSIDEFLGTSVVDLYWKAEDRQRFLDEMKDRGYVKNRELIVIKKDGSQFWAGCTAKAGRILCAGTSSCRRRCPIRASRRARLSCPWCSRFPWRSASISTAC